jgi:hypothetical protein
MGLKIHAPAIARSAQTPSRDHTRSRTWAARLLSPAEASEPDGANPPRLQKNSRRPGASKRIHAALGTICGLFGEVPAESCGFRFKFPKSPFHDLHRKLRNFQVARHLQWSHSVFYNPLFFVSSTTMKEVSTWEPRRGVSYELAIGRCVSPHNLRSSGHVGLCQRLQQEGSGFTERSGTEVGLSECRRRKHRRARGRGGGQERRTQAGDACASTTICTPYRRS